jgi:hypothetical protein
MRRIIASLAATVLLVISAAPALAGGPPAVGFYVDDQLYRTVGTPTDFTNTGAPSFTYDRIFALGNGLRNVAEAKPGDRDFNGGRWAVMPVEWHVAPYQLTSAEAVFTAEDAGDLTVATSPTRLFFCSVSRIPPSH